MDNKERRLEADHPALTAIYEGVNWTGLNGWQQLSPSVLVHETVIDLSGYTRDALTFFPTGVGLQDPGVYTFDPVLIPEFPQKALQVLDIVTSIPMDLLQVATTMQQDNAAPGMIGSQYQFESILFGAYRWFTPNTQIVYPNYMQLERSERFDSGEPSASENLYCYRIVQTIQQDLADGNTLQIPAARQLISGVIAQESDLVYMQRLKRSYELANQV
jgi:hypothetical protein|tara:strand:- start:481 stop:1131 length:651 start_codon:yes stop_codon:yes gene_type:complete